MLEDGVSTAEVTACLNKILHSTAFAQAGRLQEFLRFIVEQSLSGNAGSLKETVIGVSVFGRDPGYDPKLDNIVRTYARRVRTKLEEYYEAEGQADPLRIQLPKGSYVPIFEAGLAQTKAPPIEVESPAGAAVALPPEHPAVEKYGASRKMMLAAIGVAVIVLGCLFLVFLKRTRATNESWHSVPFTSAAGYQTFSAFSPDGTRLAYTWGGPEDGPYQIYVQSVGSQSAQPLTSGTSFNVRPAWSPDGKQIAYVELGQGDAKHIRTLALNDGKSREIAAIEGGSVWLCEQPRVSWSPSGGELLSVAAPQANQACGVVRIDVRTGAVRFVTQPSTGVLADIEPAFSPDGREIAFIRESSASIGDIFIVPAGGGTPRQVTFDRREIRGFTWAADGKSLIVCSRRNGDFLNLWRVSVDSRSATPLTEGPVSLGFPSISKKGDRIAYTAYLDDVNIWRMANGSNQVWIGSRGRDGSPAYSPDGAKIAYSSDRAGNMDLWVADASGRNPVRLTNFSPSPTGSPVWSPDGQRLAFDVRIEGQSYVYLIDATPGNQPYRLTKWPGPQMVPGWSRDGRFVYFVSTRSGVSNIYRVAVAAGDPIQITQNGGSRSMESPDGRYLYYTRGTVEGLWRLSLTGSRVEEPVLPHFPSSMWASWAVGEDGLYYVVRDAAQQSSKSSASVELYHADSGKSEILGHIGGGLAAGLSVSPDGKTILYCQYDQSGSEILLLEH